MKEYIKTSELIEWLKGEKHIYYDDNLKDIYRFLATEHMLVYLYYYKERIKYLPNYKYNVKIYTWDELYNKKSKDKKLSFSDIYREATKVYNKYNLFC